VIGRYLEAPASPLAPDAYYWHQLVGLSVVDEAGAAIGGGTQKFGFFASASGSGSDYFTDPVNFANFNNKGNTERGFIRFDAQPGDSSSAFRFSALVGRTDRGVTNTFTQEEAGSDRSVATNDQNNNLGWQKVVSATAVLDITGFGRISKFTLTPSAFDAPIQADSNRSLDNYGITPSFTLTAGIHEIKAGFVF
jgi:hypothetical protein